MPTPRVSGAWSVTSRPPRKMLPSSSCSTPAMSRRSTVFPDPDGPNTATISPLSAASETRSSTLPVLNSLLTERISRLAILTLHRAERETLDEIALRIERKRERRGYRKHDCRRDLSILNAGSGDEGERADRDRLFLGRRQNEREDEVVPAENESQEPGRRDPRSRQRNSDAGERAPPRMTRNAIGVFNVGGEIFEIAAHDPEDERQRDELIDPDETDIGVGKPQLLEIKRERQQHQQRRREAKRQKRERDVFAEPKFEARERISRGNAENERDRDRGRRQKHAIP